MNGRPWRQDTACLSADGQAVPFDGRVKKLPRVADLHALANWLKACQATTVAMESTGVYWIPVHQILEAHGFDVVLVNARHAALSFACCPLRD